MDHEQAKASLIEGLRLVRHGQLEEAVPHLEIASQDTELAYAPATLRVVRAILAGVETVEVKLGERTFRFVLQSGNVGLDMHHVEGHFFETDELMYCARVVPRRSVIVDVGANTGNHIVFFLGFLEPRLVIPVEPVPQAVDVLKRNLRLNKMTVDTRGLGLAAGRDSSKLSLKQESGLDLVTAAVKPREEGDIGPAIKSVRLDDLVREKVDFLKIDVEGFEDSVIAGAERILSFDKPLLMLEASDDTRETLLALIGRYGYRPIKEFQGYRYRNIFCRVQ